MNVNEWKIIAQNPAISGSKRGGVATSAQRRRLSDAQPGGERAASLSRSWASLRANKMVPEGQPARAWLDHQQSIN
jgi:hypothetical protein